MSVRSDEIAEMGHGEGLSMRYAMANPRATLRIALVCCEAETSVVRATAEYDWLVASTTIVSEGFAGAMHSSRSCGVLACPDSGTCPESHRGLDCARGGCAARACDAIQVPGAKANILL